MSKENSPERILSSQEISTEELVKKENEPEETLAPVVRLHLFINK